jgi:predicted secreted acid phosphatase
MSAHRRWLIRTRGASVRAGAFAAAVACSLIALKTSPAIADDPPKCPDKEIQYSLEATQPLNLGQLKQQLFSYKCFHYDAEVAAVLKEARSYVEDRASQVTKPALVLDIDETSLSNWLEIQHNDYGNIVDGPCDLDSRWACGGHAWDLSHRAEAIKPTLELFNAAKAKNVAVFFITGRRDDPEERAATAATLRAAGYEGWLGLILRPPSSSGPVGGYKTTAREAIEATGYKIIANVGDQHSDLDGGYAERIFKVPNPFYFLP